VFVPALEGRAIVNLQMGDTFAALLDINAAVSIEPTAELLTNRGIIHQASQALQRYIFSMLLLRDHIG